MSKTDSPQSTEAAKEAVVEKRSFRSPYSFLFRITHWLVGLSLLGLIATGLSLHSSSRPDWSFFRGIMQGWMWEGRVGIWHIGLAILFVVGIVPMVWLYSRRAGRRRLDHHLLVLGGLLALITGAVLLKPFGSMQVYFAARLIHLICGMIVLPLVFVIHLLTGMIKSRKSLGAAFHPTAEPSWGGLGWAIAFFIIASALVLGFLPKPTQLYQLDVKRIDSSQTKQTDMSKLPWNEARAITAPLAGGVGFDRGRTDVVLRGLHNGNELFIKAEWDDPTESRQYMPWQKTRDGWKRLAGSRPDELFHYEDKFSMIFPTGPDEIFQRFGCAAYCHLDSEKGYGYKAASDQWPVDVWHWKAARTDPVGQVDDKYWAKPKPDSPKNGRFSDPKTGGGYKTNQNKDNSAPAWVSSERKRPLRGAIPAELAVVLDNESVKLVPVDKIVPGVKVAKIEGDRGDVLCESDYRDGRWTLYIRRKLETGSQFDVQFEPGGSYSFGVAAFDHTGQRHAYDYSVYQMKLDE
jgi:cytochrome b subunit of formate dehydrogenase